MIVSKDINPERDIYFLGAQLIEILDSFATEKIDFLDAYEKMKYKTSLSINLFSLVLDWLFLIGSVKSENQYIVKCF